MTQNKSNWGCKLSIASIITICGAIASCENCTFAQVIPDNTLGSESSVVTPIAPLANQIEGGATRGTNLFHSFEQFSIPTNGKVHFNNNPTIQNIISRITGSSASNIDGLIKANGTANLFLINPNGIIFGSNASLNIGGSFIASTASSLNFADSNQFNATNPQTSPLLTLSIPIGLQFGANPGSIINRSQASPDGAVNSLNIPIGLLRVQTGKTLALVGGDVLLEGGHLTAEGGRIELGSVTGNSIVRLNPIEKGWALSYEGIENFQNIQLNPLLNFNGSNIQSFVDASGEAGGDIHLQGKLIRLTDSSLIAATTGKLQPGNLTVNALDSLELSGSGTALATLTSSSGDAGEITINTGQLIIRNGAQVYTLTSSSGSGGQLTVNATDSVKLIGSFPSQLDDNDDFPSSLTSETAADGNAGNLRINTKKLLIQDGAQVSTASTKTIDLSSGQFTLATGRGGNLNVNASDWVELIGTDRTGVPSLLTTLSQGVGDAGDLNIATKNLIVRDRAEATVSSQGSGNAGNIQVQANSILLNNGGKLLSTSTLGKGGGDITLKDLNLLRLGGKSEISTNALSSGKGGNIQIDTDLLIGTGNSDITANAIEGEGGFIQITSQGVFGLAVREQVTENSDITAISQNSSLNGVVELNRANIDPNANLVILPAQIIDISRLVASGCSASGDNLAKGTSELVVTGRGGLPPTPTEATKSDTTLVDLGTPIPVGENRLSAEIPSNTNTNSDSTTLVEAQGWVIGSKGEVILTANAPTGTPDIPWLMPTSCNRS